MSDALILRTRNVFIDTQAYAQEHFRFDHAKLKKLQELGKTRKIWIYTTDTIVGEVKSKISEKMAEAVAGLSQFQGAAGLLQATAEGDLALLFSPVTEKILIEQGHGIWNRFLTGARVTTLDSSSIKVSTLLEKYFKGLPPFGAGKKKSEFPDAISTLSIEAWAERCDEELYIISGDNDLKKWSDDKPYIHHLKSIGEFLNIYNRTEEKLTELVEHLCVVEEAQIASKIRKSFLNCGFVTDHFGTEVSEVDVCRVVISDINVIEIGDNYAALSILVEIEFSATISGEDYNAGIWDSEDKKYIYVPDFYVEQRFTETYDVSLGIGFDPETGALDEIYDVMFDDGTDITVHYDDGFPWK